MIGSMTDAERDLWNQRPDSTHQLVEMHLQMVRGMAKVYRKRLPRSVDLYDLVQSGVIGLIKAISRFDVNQGTLFSTYALRFVQGAMADFMREMDDLSRGDRRRGVTHNFVRFCDIGPKSDAGGSPLAEGEEWLEQKTAYEEKGFTQIDHREQIEHLVRCLNTNQRTVLILNFLEHQTLKQIGVGLGLCESRCSQLRTEALALVRAIHGDPYAP